MTPNLTSEECQMMVLALAHLSVYRPGWKDALREIASKTQGGAANFDLLRHQLDRRFHHPRLAPKDMPAAAKKLLDYLEQEDESATSA